MSPSRRGTRRAPPRGPTTTRTEAPACTRPHSPSPAPTASRRKCRTTARTVGITNAPHGPRAMWMRTKMTKLPRARSTHLWRALPAPTTPNLRVSVHSLSGSALAHFCFRTSQTAQPMPISRVQSVAGCSSTSSCGATSALRRFLSSTRLMPRSSTIMPAGTICTSGTRGLVYSNYDTAANSC